MLTGILSKKIKSFDTGLKSMMSNLVNGTVKLKFSKFVLVRKNFLRCIVTLF